MVQPGASVSVRTDRWNLLLMLGSDRKLSWRSASAAQGECTLTINEGSVFRVQLDGQLLDSASLTTEEVSLT